MKISDSNKVQILLLMRIFLIFLMVFSFQMATYGQVPPQAQAELDKRGLTEQEVRNRMKEKGFDLDNVDPNNPAEVLEVQKALEETIKELEAEKAATKSAESSPTAPATGSTPEATIPQTMPKPSKNGEKLATEEALDNIETAVNEGESLENALAEEFSETVQMDLPPSIIYGQHLFRGKSIKLFKQSEDATPPDTYVLGAGDQINISIWGTSQADFNLEVQKDGYIYATGLPRMYLKGLTLSKAKSLLKSRFSNYYRFRPEEFQASIRFVRTITVNIFGEAINYGSFNIPATNTAFNALVAAGGPSDIGSVRNIQLKRGDQSQQIDVYEYMSNPVSQYNLFLQNNDIIFIPIAERLVSIMGSIKRPFKYELIEGENLAKLIEYAGGFTTEAYQKVIQIKRIVNDEETIMDVPMRELLDAKKDFVLLNGDVVTIKSIPKPYQNYVEISGEIELPGRYAFEKGMRVSDLLEKAILQKETRKDFAYLWRTNENETSKFIRINLADVLANVGSSEDVLLQPEDRIITFAQARFADNSTISINGAVRNPTVLPYDYDESLTVEDLVLLAGGLLPNASNLAYIKRQDITNRENVEYIEIDIKSILDGTNTNDNRLILQPFDEISILSTEVFTDEFLVKVEGAVRKPGSFKYGKSLKVKDLLIMAGGLEFGASSSRIDLFRVQVKDNEPTKTMVAQISVDENFNITSGGEFLLQPFDLIYVRQVPSFELQQVVEIEGQVLYPGSYALASKNERIYDLIQRAGGLTLESFPAGAYLIRKEGQPGSTIINLDKIMEKPDSRYNFILKKGDFISIPKIKELVTIKLDGTLAAELYPDKMLQGGVINVAYKKGKRADWYLDKYAAGLDLKNGARHRFVTVEHPNGRIEKVFGLISSPKVSKGSVIKVGKKKKKEKKEKEKVDREPIDWERVITSSFALISSALTIIVLGKQL